ncbi:hypothetical protein L3Q82_018288 [Scortum barcoo]|uniref:Uncharacterized protein n=1 Tax=Scortum barcoo TaxID=214431 RepID=A0ACB8VIL4_9TELE|nr:hypothetical protein L3Q82_018288 [Scortum barcoo]
MLACGTPDAVDRYRQAKQAVALDGPGGKNSGLGGVRWGAVDLNMGDIVGRWKKYFEDLLNPTDLPSNEEAEAGVSEVEVTEVVLLPGKVYAQGTGEENSADSPPSDSGGTMRFSSLVVEHWTSSIPSTGCLRGPFMGCLDGPASTEQELGSALLAGIAGSRSESGKGGVPSPGWLGAPLEIGEKLGHSGGARSRARCSFASRGSQLRWLGHLFRMPPGRLPRDGVPGMSHQEEASGKTQDTLERLCLSAAGLGTPQSPPGRARGSVWGEGSLGISAQTAASATRSRTKRLKLDGWILSPKIIVSVSEAPDADRKHDGTDDSGLGGDN